MTLEQLLTLLGITPEQLAALKRLATALIAQDEDPDVPNSPEIAGAVVKVGGAIAILDNASVQAGGTGYSMIGLAQNIGLLGVLGQITGYEEGIEAKRAKALADNTLQEQNDAQPLQVEIAALENDPAITSEGLVTLARKRAALAAIRTAQAGRIQEAEEYAQEKAPIVAGLKVRLRAMAAGDWSAV